MVADLPFSSPFVLIIVWPDGHSYRPVLSIPSFLLVLDTPLAPRASRLRRFSIICILPFHNPLGTLTGYGIPISILVYWPAVSLLNILTVDDSEYSHPICSRGFRPERFVGVKPSLRQSIPLPTYGWSSVTSRPGKDVGLDGNP